MVVHQDQDWQIARICFGAAARVMRRILVDYARARNARKRDGGNAVSLDETPAVSPERSDGLLAPDEALARRIYLGGVHVVVGRREESSGETVRRLAAAGVRALPSLRLVGVG